MTMAEKEGLSCGPTHQTKLRFKKKTTKKTGIGVTHQNRMEAMNADTPKNNGKRGKTPFPEKKKSRESRQPKNSQQKH